MSLRDRYIIITVFVVCRRETNAYDFKYTLLQPPDDAVMKNDSYTPGRQAYKFDVDDPVRVDPRTTGLIGKTLSAPFIVTATFKTITYKAEGDLLMCFFSLTQDDLLIIRVCLYGGGSVFLFSQMGTYPLFTYDMKGDAYGWNKLIFHIRDDTLDIYENCKNMIPDDRQYSLLKGVNLLLTRQLKITFFDDKTSSNMYSGTYYRYEGLVEEVSLYTNADDDSLKTICKEGWRSISPVKRGDSETDENDVQFSAAAVVGHIDHQAPRGPPGMPGAPGRDGPQGMMGIMGYQGLPGPGGEVGPKGDKGAKGDMGLYGEKGKSGEKGDRGLLGVPGFSGEKGDKGDHGIPGHDGIPASLLSVLDGENAAVVEKLRGLKGETGPSGYMGQKGDQGREGSRGERGEKGDRGDRGVSFAGEKGEPGRDGTPGDRGYPGAVGPQGPPGICVIGPPGPPEQRIPVFLPRSTIGAKYTLLKPPGDAELVDESYSPGASSYKFTTREPVPVDPNATNLVGVNLSAPFIVVATFKSFISRPVCLFSITQDQRTTLSLCLTTASQNTSRLSLITELYSPEDSISFLFNGDFINKWIKIVLYVKDDSADLYLNGSKQLKLLSGLKDKDILQMKDNMKIELAVSKSKLLKFAGLIEEISLYTNADNDTLLYARDEARNMPTLTSSNVEEHGGKNRNERTPLEFASKNELAECRREITVIKEDLNNKIENATITLQNEMTQNLEDLKSSIEFLTEKLMDVLESVENIKAELDVVKRK